MDYPDPIEPPCMGCQGDDFAPLLHGVKDWVWRRPGTFTVARCTRCDLVMTRPRPADLGPYYENAYAGDSPIAAFKRRGEAPDNHVNRSRLTLLNRYRRPGPKDHVLDVGCSHGGYLKHLRDQTGCTTTGIDLDAASIDEAFDPEHCTYLHTTLLDAAFPADSFDLVTFMECLEHDPDPLASLCEACRVVRPGGWVVVEVPNFDSFWRERFGRYWLPLLAPQHLVHFTPASLTDLVERAGLEVIALEGLFFPFEFVSSAWMVWCGVSNVPPVHEPPKLRLLLDLFVASWLLPLWVLVELPSQWWLARKTRSGHLTLLARAPATNAATAAVSPVVTA